MRSSEFEERIYILEQENAALKAELAAFREVKRKTVDPRVGVLSSSQARKRKNKEKSK